MATQSFWYSLPKIGKTMKGLQNADARLTQLCMQSLPASNFGLMRCALNGTQFTNNALVHTGLVASSECQYCKKPDSGRHRHWECEYLCRHPQTVSWHFWPGGHGRTLLAQSWMDATVPGFTRAAPMPFGHPRHDWNYMVPPQASCRLEYQDLFSDGSCIYPADATLRVSSWGVVWMDWGWFLACFTWRSPRLETN